MVIITATDSRQICDNRDASIAEHFRAANARTLEDRRRSEGSRRDNDQLVHFDRSVCGVLGYGFVDHPGGLAILHEDSDDFGLNDNIELLLLVRLKTRLQVSAGRILARASGGDVSQSPLDTVAGVQVVDILNLGPAHLSHGRNKGVLRPGRVEGTARNLNRPVGAMGVQWSGSLVRLELRCITVS